MRILSWNINGLRSLKGDLNQRLKDLNADIICLQETKVTREYDTSILYINPRQRRVLSAR